MSEQVIHLTPSDDPGCGDQEDEPMPPFDSLRVQSRQSASSTIDMHEPKPFIQPAPQSLRASTHPSIPTRSGRNNTSIGGSVSTPPPGGHRGRSVGTPSSSPLGWLMAIVAILLILLLLAGIVMRNIFGQGVVYSATVTITPSSRDQENVYVIMAAIGLSDASRREVEARFLSNTSISKPIIVSGAGHIPATTARGNLTLYNALPYSQTVVSGTVITDKSGVQVVIDRSVIIPPARPPAEGTLTILAHSSMPGSKGNIPAFAFNDVPCCMAGITVQNRAAFKGGQDQREYPYVQQSDIDGAVNSEKASLKQQAESTLNAELFPNEKFVNTGTCTSNYNADHAARDKVTSITILVSVTCTNEAFDQQGAELIARNLLTAQSIRDLGPDFALAGKVLTRILTKICKIIPLKAYHDALMLCVSAEGIWVHRFSNRTKRMFAELIAGKKLTAAQSILMHYAGVLKADIHINGKHTDTLPSDPEHIAVDFQKVHE